MKIKDQSNKIPDVIQNRISELNDLPLKVQLTVPTVPHEAESIFEHSKDHLLTVWGILLAFSIVFVVLGNLMLHRVSKDTR